MSVLFVEIGCEEIPALLQVKGVADLRDGLCRRLAALGFTAEPGGYSATQHIQLLHP